MWKRKVREGIGESRLTLMFDWSWSQSTFPLFWRKCDHFLKLDPKKRSLSSAVSEED